MTSKTDTLNRGRQKVITYGQVMEDLNYIAKTSGEDTAYFDVKLKDPSGKKVCGFVFNGIATGLKLSQLLSKLHIKYSHYYPEPTPLKGELYIDSEYSQMAKNLFSAWSSWIIVEKRITGNKEIDAKWMCDITKMR